MDGLGHARGGKPRLLLTGSEYPAGLAALRSLDRAGFETWAAVPSPGALGARSRAAAGTVPVPDPRTAPDEFAAVLAAAAERLGVAAVLPGTEAALLALANREGLFAAGTAVGTAPEAMLRRATDKVALALLALRAGLDAPITRVVAAGENLADEELTFPAIVKPLRSELLTPSGLQRFEAKRVESSAEMELALELLPDEVGLVQPYVDGRLISVNGVAFEGALHGANQHVVHRVWPDRCGSAVYAETIPMTEERERTVAAFVSDLGWSGVFNVQLIERDGRDYVIDFNPRCYVSLSLATAAGLNLPAIWASLLLGLPFDANGYNVGVRFREELGDTRAILSQVRHGRLTSRRGLLPRRGTVHALFSKKDPRPGLSLVSVVLAAVGRKVRARSR